MANPTIPVATLARLFNLTERRIQQLAKDGVIPKPEKGKYDLIASTQGYIKYLQDRAAGKDIEPRDTYIERARLLKAQADKTEIEVKALNGDLIAAEQVELMWAGLVSSFRARMMALPVRCAHRVMNITGYQEIEEILRGHVNEALEELSRYEPEPEQSAIVIEEGGDDGGSATELEDQPVGGSVPATKQ
jgi:phage terminase Nu1 subunit (DNA packaging protein)